MSAAVQRRQRGLDRERANIGRYGARKSSIAMMRADLDGESTLEETAAATMGALLYARKMGGAIVVAEREQQQRCCLLAETALLGFGLALGWRGI